MKKNLGYLLLSFSLVAITVSCNKDKIGDFDPVEEVNPFTGVCTDTVFYSTIVQPIIMNNCAVSGCHSSDAAGGFVFESHAIVSANANLILNTIKHKSGFTAMPQGAVQLSGADIQNIECWINQGKMNN